MATTKFYKDSNGIFFIGDASYPAGVYSANFSENDTKVTITNVMTGEELKPVALITSYTTSAGVAYADRATFSTALKDFFVKSAGNASGVEMTPAGNVSSTNVQDAVYELDNEKVDDLGGTIYHSTPWFTPVDGQSVTISADGLTVTLSSGALFTSEMVGARVVVNGIRRILGSYTSTSVMGVSSAFPVSMRGVTYTYDKWGVFNSAISIIDVGGLKSVVISPINSNSSGGFLRAKQFNMIGDGSFGSTGSFWYFTSLGCFKPSYQISFSSTNGEPYNNIDVGFKRNTAGIIEVNNGSAGTYRDLNLRNLNYTGSLTNTSDERLKKNIRPVTDGLKKVIDISKTIRHYEFIDQDAYGSGVITSEIAQYLLELGFDGHVKQRMPRNEDEGIKFGWEYTQREIVDQESNPVLDQDGNKTFETVVAKEGDMIYTVDSQALTIYLFPAIVELNDKITAIEERLNKAGL